MSLEKKVAYAGQKTTDTLDGKVRIEQGNGRLIVSDGVNNLGLFGYDSNGNVVVKIAKPGFDADTAGNNDLIFNSNQDVFKIVGKGTISGTKPVNSSFYTVTQAHGLGYTPVIQAFMLISGSTYRPTELAQFDTSTGLCFEYTTVEVNNVNVVLRMTAPNIAGGFYGSTLYREAQYFLLQESIT